MRTADRPLPFAGTDEELEQYLQEFSAATGGWAASSGLGVRRDGRRGGWWISSGAGLSSNPNTIPLRMRISRSEGGLLLGAEGRTLPWTRGKIGRIAEYRLGQLADYLTARVRGSGPEKFRLLPFRDPFSPFGSGVASVTASFAWVLLTAVATGIAALAAMALAAVPFLSWSIREISQHSASLLAAGAIPLPSPAEAAATGAFLPALVFAVPIAFLFALVHSAALVACDLGSWAARLPLASLLFQGIVLLVAFVPFGGEHLLASFLPVLAVPAAVHLGSTLVWARRRERVREGPPPGKALLIIAVALSASLAGAAMPRPTEWKAALTRLALFRDAWLLGNPLGKAIASTYYRHTLYTAELLKEFYSVDPARPSKQQPLAHVPQKKQIPLARALGFAVATDATQADVEISDRVACRQSSRSLANPGDLAELKGALDEVSRESFRGARLRELSALGWRSIYYLGPLAALLAMMGVFAPFISILFRKLRPQLAILSLSACAIVASLSLVLLTSPRAEATDPAALAEDLAEGLVDARAAVRHEAAVRASQLGSTSALAEPLLRAANDEDLRVRLWAVAALGRSADPRAFAKLVERLDDPELFVRYRAAEALGSLGDRRAVPSLVRVLRERSWYEGSYALEALRRLEPGIH